MFLREVMLRNTLIILSVLGLVLTGMKIIELNNADNRIKARLDTLGLCQTIAPEMVKNIKIDFEYLNDMHEGSIDNIIQGGYHLPPDCRAKDHVAIIIPYRDRAETLKLLLRHLHPFLQRRRLEYRIFVIEQAGDEKFNRGKLMNIGFVEASKISNFTCFIFHDADHLPENDGIPYTCDPSPLHLASALDVFGYKLYYPGAYSGANGFTPEHFMKINGFSNLYYGWGAEDDDLLKRVLNSGFQLNRLPFEIGRFKKLDHPKAQKNGKNYALLKRAEERQFSDGLNSLRYTLIEKKFKHLFTWFLVDIKQIDDTKTYIKTNSSNRPHL